VECEPLSSYVCPAIAPDAGPGDAVAPDCGAPDAAACAGEGDCDGLPQARDPWPKQCNPLLWQETFAQELDDDTWGVVYNGLHIYVGSCGLLEWTAPPHNTIWAWVDEELGATLDPAALVELRALPKLRGRWALTLGVNVTSDASSFGWPEDQGRSCAVTFADGRLTLTSRVYHADGPDSGRADESFTASGSLVLQNWIEGTTLHCRVVQEGGEAVSLETEITGAMPEAGTIKLTFVNQDVVAPYTWLWIDSLRVFAPGS
jgi:hypothetical protein